MKSLLLVLLLLASCDCSESEKAMPPGTIVVHKLTGEKGIVVRYWADNVEVRIANYETRLFEPFEFEPLQSTTVETKPSSEVVAPYTTGERKWDPETKSYR